MIDVDEGVRPRDIVPNGVFPRTRSPPDRRTIRVLRGDRSCAFAQARSRKR